MIATTNFREKCSGFVYAIRKTNSRPVQYHKTANN
jgi:hypothetical protein